MKKEDVVSLLKENKYLFELKGNQIVVKLAKRYSLNLYIKNDTVVKSEDVVRQFGLLANEKSLKKATKTNLIRCSAFVVPCIVLFLVFEPDVLSDSAGILLIIGLVYTMLWPLFEYLYYNRRLLKIKKILNLDS